MQKPLEIRFQQMDPSPAVEARIREKVEALERVAPRMTSCRVVVEKEDRHQTKGNLFRVRLDIGMPGKEIAVSRAGPKDHAHEDIYVAVRDAFAAAQRQLRERSRSVAGKVKQHEAPLTGRIGRLFPDEGYGFVETTAGDVYFHRNSVANGGFDRLTIGEEVRLEVAENESPDGWQATTVQATGRVLAEE